MLVSAEDIACHLLKKEQILWKKAFIIKYFIFFYGIPCAKILSIFIDLKKNKIIEISNQ